MSWKKHLEDSWYREEDGAYAGKDHTKNNKTFICLYDDHKNDLNVEKIGFKTLENAMQYVDTHCPIKGNTL